jgi:hypothetical protein
MNNRTLRILVVLMIGISMIHFGDRLLGVRIELFSGLSTFSFAWILDVFFVPFLVGLTVSWIYGLGGKWLCYFPPIIVRCLSYAEIYYVSGTPPGSNLNPIGWWCLYVVLAVESAAMGGVVGEVMNKSVYGRSNRGGKEQPVATEES